MIYLITGTPGTGKTSFVIKAWLDNVDGLFKYDDGTPRPLFFNHIQGLNKKALSAHELTDDAIQSQPLNELVPEGSVVIVDECDYLYPVRGPARPVPEYIRTLKELRHYGLTLILITQNAAMLDSYLRGLIGKHWHLSRRPIGSKLYEFNGIEQNLSESNLKTSAWRPYKVDKRTFQYYESASVHIKFNKKLHWAFYALPLILLFAGYFIFQSYKNINNNVKISDKNQIDASIVQPSIPMVPPAAGTGSVSGFDLKAKLYVPTLSEKPESKPLYNQIRQVHQYERVAGCVAGGKSGCTCYSDQATRLKEIPEHLCLSYVENGLPFDPFREPVQYTGEASQTILANGN